MCTLTEIGKEREDQDPTRTVGGGWVSIGTTYIEQALLSVLRTPLLHYLTFSPSSQLLTAIILRTTPRL